MENASWKCGVSEPAEIAGPPSPTRCLHYMTTTKEILERVWLKCAKIDHWMQQETEPVNTFEID